MPWWKRLWPGRTDPIDARLLRVHLAMQGWRDEGTRDGMRGWRDGDDVMSLVVIDDSFELPRLSDDAAVQQFARSLAESRGAGLIEVWVSTGPLGPAVSMVHKRLLKPAYVFSGMLIAPEAQPPQVWTIVAGERGMTGVREATITAEFFNSGTMTIEDYERSWAKDPYDADYDGVDRSVLRFVSDDEVYDERFAQHPLSKVRRILRDLPGSVYVDPASETS